MPICTRCGQNNPDDAIHCSKCGIAFVHQRYARDDAKRSRSGLIIRTIGWIAALIVLAVVGPPVYHTAGAAYLKHRLNTAADRAMKDCGGPASDTMGANQKDQIDACILQNADLKSAQSDYDSFTKSDKH